MKKCFVGNITSSRRRQTLMPLLSGSLLLILLAVSLLKELPVRADAPIAADLTTSYFGITFLQVTPGNLSDARHATFTLTNSSGFWYGFIVSSNPNGLKPQATDPLDDPLGAAFASEMLLQPADVIPTGQPGLDLAVSFTAPNQQMQMTLNPFDPNAGALNTLRLVLNLIGVAYQPGGTGGLAKSGVIKQVLDDVDKVGAFVKLVNDFIAAEHAVPTGDVQGHMVAFFNDLLAITSDAPLRGQFAAILAETGSQGAFPHIDFNPLLQAIPVLGPLSVLIQFGVAFEDTLANRLLTGGYDPTVLLTSRLAKPATSNSTATATPSVTDTPTLTATATATATSKPPTLTPTPTSTIKPGGLWISPNNGDTVTDPVSFAAHAYPTNPGDPPIDHVNFTVNAQGTWMIACTVTTPISGDMYTCTVNLQQLGVAYGQVQVSFDVYDSAGHNNLAPNGVHTVT
jgi:hypothetical protein